MGRTDAHESIDCSMGKWRKRFGVFSLYQVRPSFSLHQNSNPSESITDISSSTRVQPPISSLSPTTLYKTGTHVNKTHWQYTAKCSGCTSYTGAKSGSSSSSSTKVSLTPTGTNQLAFAFASAKPSNPSSNTSATLGVHDVYAYWQHDFSVGKNTNWGALVGKLK